MTDEDRTNWPSAAKSIVADITLAAVVIALLVWPPSCCDHCAPPGRRDAQEQRLRKVPVKRPVQESRKAEVPGDDRPVPELQSDCARGKLQGPGQEPGP